MKKKVGWSEKKEKSHFSICFKVGVKVHYLLSYIGKYCIFLQKYRLYMLTYVKETGGGAF